MTTDRRCGDCQLCCRLLPTAEIAKPALEKCPHQKVHKGCAIYARRPMSCALWNCRWLVDDSTRDLPRPDRAHYVIDLIPDFVSMVPHDGSPPTHIEVIQVWVDPAHKDAHRSPAFRAWLAKENKPAVIRYSSADGFILFPPGRNETGQWVEYQDSLTRRETTLEEKAAALGGSLTVDLDIDPSEAAHYRTTLTVAGKAIPVAAGHASPEIAREARRNVRQIADDRAARK